MSSRRQGLDEANRVLETHGEIRSSYWREWLWGVDPHAPLAKRALMNRSHMLGLLLCRFWAGSGPAAWAQMQGSGGARGRTGSGQEHERIQLMDKSPAEMTLRELRDTIDNMAIELPSFAWGSCSQADRPERITAIEDLVNECFARLGVLASTVEDGTVLNDTTSTEPSGQGQGQFRLSKTFLRRSMCTFLALFRNIYMWKRARHVPPDAVDATRLAGSITKHHVEASNEDFHLLCMHHTLPIGATLAYKVDFPGMYNHVSQVVYFNNSKYERQCRPGLAEIPVGSPLHCLSAIMQLHPDVGVVYESDGKDLAARGGKWRWAVFPGMVYLVDPGGVVYHSTNLMQLYQVYLQGVKGKGFAVPQAKRPKHG